MASWSALFSRSENAAELRATFEDNLYGDDDSSATMKPRRTSNRLSTVTSKLRKHFSGNSAVSKRLSRSSVGNSEEEIERRKELRRLRDKRIQEELSIEGFDDDAASLSTVSSSDMLSPSPYGTSPLPPPQDESVGFLRTTIKHENHRISGCNTSFSSDQSPESTDLPNPTVSLALVNRIPQFPIAELVEATPKALPVVKRRHSYTCIRKPEDSTELISIDCSTPWNCSYPDIPSAPALKPQRLPSIADPAIRRTSWRLSFTSDQRSCHLRALIQDYNQPAKTSGFADACQQSTNFNRFRSQVQRLSPQPLIVPSGHASDLDNLTSHKGLCSSSNDFGGVDGNLESQGSPIHLWEMQISRRLASRGLHSHTSSPQLSSRGSYTHRRGCSISSDRSWISRPSQTRHYKASSSGAIENVTPNGWTNFIRGNTSATFLSSNHSILLTPESSQLKISSTIGIQPPKEMLRAIDLEDDTIVPKESAALIPDLKINSLTPRFIAHRNRSEKQPTLVSSFGASERACSHQLEDELKFIETRFPDSVARQGSTVTVSSKFKEEFEVSLPLTHAKPSIFSVLRLSRKAEMPQNNGDSALPLDCSRVSRYRGYGYSFANTSPKSSDSKFFSKSIQAEQAVSPPAIAVSANLTPGESTAAMWSRIISRTQKEHSRYIRGDIKLPEEKTMELDKEQYTSFIAIKRLSEKTKSKQKVGFGDGDGDGLAIKSEEMIFNLENEEDVQITQGSDLGPNAYEVWVSHLQLQEETALRNKTALLEGKQETRQAQTPESWARYPSHTRLERCGEAGPSDHIHPKDFAGNSNCKAEMLTGKLDHDVNNRHHSILVRISKKIRESWYRMMTSKMTTLNNPIASHGRRSSTSLGGDLEYPELEVLPIVDEFNGLKEINEDAAVAMGRQEIIQKKAINFERNSAYKSERPKYQRCGITETSIASPSFYEDCIFHPPVEDVIDNMISTESTKTITLHPLRRQTSLDKETFKREKYRTWNGRDIARKHLAGSMNLRRKHD